MSPIHNFPKFLGADACIKSFKDFKFIYDFNDDVVPFFENCIQYLPWLELKKIIPVVFARAGYEVIELLADRVIKMNQLELLDEVEQLFNSWGKG